MNHFQEPESPRIRLLVSQYEQLIAQTERMVRAVDPTLWDSVPIDTDVMHLGERVNRIAIAGLLKHYAIAETHWLTNLPRAAEGEPIGFPSGGHAFESVAAGEPLLEALREASDANVTRLRAYSDALLDAEVSFGPSTYTVEGFLHTMLTHRGFHLGQIDLLARQHNVQPGEYMEWPLDRRIG